MRQISSLALLVICFAILAYAADTPNAEEMHGTICDSKCVTQVSNTASCNPDCTEKSGVAVFVDDNGSVKQIANQDICKSYMGKHVKMKARERQPESDYLIQELEQEHP